MDSLLKPLTQISLIIGILVSLVLIYGVLISFIKSIQLEIQRLRGQNIQSQRSLVFQNLGDHLMLAVNILIAANLIKIIALLEADWKDLALLGILILLRIGFGFTSRAEAGQSSKQSTSDPRGNRSRGRTPSPISPERSRPSRPPGDRERQRRQP